MPFEKESESSIDLEIVNKNNDVPKAKKSVLDFIFIGMIYFAIELAFSIEIALTVPILLKLNITENAYSFVYFLSPLIGFIVQPILGSLSDRCQSPMGRRRPFILALSILAFFGISLILNGYSIGQVLGDNLLAKPIVAICLIALGVTILDFAADSCDSPLRAYIIDTCNSEDNNTGFNVHAFLGGSGAALGYLITSIDWENSLLADYIDIDESTLMSIIVTLVFVLSIVSTMVASKEKQIIIAKETIRKSLFQETKDLLIFLTKMPKELNRLFIFQTLGWLAFFSVTFFFTDFVAQVIFKGDPFNENQTNYNLGVKMGSLCLLAYSIGSALYAVLLEKYLLKKFSTKALFTVAYSSFLVSCVLIYFVDNIYIIICLSTSFGLLLTVLSTLPYKMIYEFNQTLSNASNCKQAEVHGIGLDCSVLSCSFFLAQMLVASFMSLAIYSFGNRVILIAGAVFSALGVICNYCFILFPK